MNDNFRGDTAALIRSINSLLDLDADGAIVPHGLGSHVRVLLESASIRLAEITQPVGGLPAKLNVVKQCSCTNPWAHDQCTNLAECKIKKKLFSREVKSIPHHTIDKDVPIRTNRAKTDVSNCA